MNHDKPQPSAIAAAVADPFTAQQLIEAMHQRAGVVLEEMRAATADRMAAAQQMEVADISQLITIDHVHQLIDAAGVLMAMHHVMVASAVGAFDGTDPQHTINRMHFSIGQIIGTLTNRTTDAQPTIDAAAEKLAGRIFRTPDGGHHA